MTATIVPQQDPPVQRARCLRCGVYIQPGRGLFCSDACRRAYAAAVAASLKPVPEKTVSRLFSRAARGAYHSFNDDNRIDDTWGEDAILSRREKRRGEATK